MESHEAFLIVVLNQNNLMLYLNLVYKNLYKLQEPWDLDQATKQKLGRRGARLDHVQIMLCGIEDEIITNFLDHIQGLVIDERT